MRVAHESQALRRLNILFVDSDPNIREKMQQTLGNMFALRCVASIAEAKEYLSVFLPDVLISEVVLGQENGLDLCRYVRDTDRKSTRLNSSHVSISYAVFCLK